MTTRVRTPLLITLVAVAILGVLPWNGRPMPFRASELRVLMCARNMAEGGDWLVPVYEREVRINKPPLMYWVVATVFLAAGGTESLALARGVNGVFGVLLVAATYWCGRHWVGRRRAWMGALAAATCYLFLRFARLCETDVALTLFTTLACFGLWRAAAGRRGVWWWVLAGVFSGVGFLFKGPAALALPLAALATGYITRAVPSWKHGAAGALMFAAPFVVIVLPWYLYLLSGRVQVAAENDIGYEMAALMKESPHHGPIIYYLYALPALMMPWGLLLPPAILQAWRRRSHCRIRFLLGWLASAVVVMSLVKSKQEHYAMLLLPPAALLTGNYLGAVVRNRRSDRYKVTRGVLCVLRWGVVAAGVAAAGLPHFVEGVSRAAGLLWGLPLILAGVLAPLVRCVNPVRGDLAVLAAAAVWGAAGCGAVFHEFGEPAAMYRECATEVRGRVGEATRVFIAGRRAVPMEYYLHRFLYCADDVAQAWKHAGPGDMVIVSVDRENTRVLTMEPPVPPVFQRKQGDVELRLYVR